jgi:hypothetical protein
MLARRRDPQDARLSASEPGQRRKRGERKKLPALHAA